MPELLLLQKKLGCRFKNTALLTQALTHKSYFHENPDSISGDNEKLEFLGDTVLSLIISEALFLNNPLLNEGDLSKRRAKVVSAPSLAAVARKIGLGAFLLLGVGEEKSQGREKPSLLADALEAVIAAIYLEKGMRGARRFILKVFSELLEEGSSISAPDYKTQLQEYAQSVLEKTPTYDCIAESGPGHQKQFEVAVRIGDTVYGTGSGTSKKAAEQQAAAAALKKLN